MKTAEFHVNLPAFFFFFLSHTSPLASTLPAPVEISARERWGFFLLQLCWQHTGFVPAQEQFWYPGSHQTLPAAAMSSRPLGHQRCLEFTEGLFFCPQKPLFCKPCRKAIPLPATSIPLVDLIEIKQCVAVILGYLRVLVKMG